MFVLFILSRHLKFRGSILFLDNKSQDQFLSFVATHHTLFHYCQEEMLSVNQQGKSKQFFVELVSIFFCKARLRLKTLLKRHNPFKNK